MKCWIIQTRAEERTTTISPPLATMAKTQTILPTTKHSHAPSLTSWLHTRHQVNRISSASFWPSHQHRPVAASFSKPKPVYHLAQPCNRRRRGRSRARAWERCRSKQCRHRQWSGWIRASNISRGPTGPSGAICTLKSDRSSRVSFPMGSQNLVRISGNLHKWRRKC